MVGELLVEIMDNTLSLLFVDVLREELGLRGELLGDELFGFLQIPSISTDNASPSSCPTTQTRPSSHSMASIMSSMYFWELVVFECNRQFSPSATLVAVTSMGTVALLLFLWVRQCNIGTSS
jgi:hypothetical protein